MNVLVTGATGFIGRHLCDLLAGAGHSVTVLSRRPNEARSLLTKISAAYRWDGEQEPPEAALQGVQAVVHLAGETLQGRWNDAKKRRIRESRVRSTHVLVQAMGKGRDRPAVFVCASSTGYYGDRGDEVLTEDSSAGSGLLAEVCQDWEQEANRAKALGVRVVNLRSGLVLGKDGGAIKALRPLFLLGLGGPLGPGKQWWSWVHVQDKAGIILHAITITSSLEGRINAVAPEPARQRDLARVFGKSMHRPALLPAPDFALRLMLGEMASELLYSRRVHSDRLQASGYVYKYPHLAHALGDLAS